MSDGYVHLHSHSEWSWDAVGTRDVHALAAAEMGQAALAATEHGNLAGSIHHINACSEHGILPILGLEAYYRPDRKVREPKELRYAYMHLTLLALNQRGWMNLMRISSTAAIDGFWQFACVDLELLTRCSEGVAVGLGCLRSPLLTHIKAGDSTAARGWVRQLKARFGDRVFGEIMPADIDDQRAGNLGVISVCQDESVMICATVDAHAPRKEWTSTQAVRLDIATNQTKTTKARSKKENVDVFEFSDDSFYLQSGAEVRANFAANHPMISPTVVDEAIRNTLVVASWVEPILMSRNEKLPRFPQAGGRSDVEVLREKARAGLQRCEDYWSRRNSVMAERHQALYTRAREEEREADADRHLAALNQALDDSLDDRRRWDEELGPVYRERLEMELGQIERSGYAAYFLQVSKVCGWCASTRGLPDKNGVEHEGKKELISVGPGRGSAGGALVSFCIGITNMDPIAYRGRFERFLNIDRRGLPDIDVDFPVKRIAEVEAYTKASFGKDNVVDVIAYITAGPRATIRKVGTARSINPSLINNACKLIDDKDRSPLEQIVPTNQPLQEISEKHPDDFADMCRLQGQVIGRCVSGDTLISSATPSAEKITIAELYARKPSRRWLKAKGMVDDGMLGVVTIEDFYSVGELPVFELRTEDRSIKTSREHQFLTPNGWKMLSELNVSDLVAVNGNKRCPCPPGCTCGKHRSTACQPGCKCARHKGVVCPPGCTCARHNSPTCLPGCTCGRHQLTSGGFQKGMKPWNAGTTGTQVAWNKGLTKETSDAVARQAEKMVGNDNGSGRAGKIFGEVPGNFRKRVLKEYGDKCVVCGDQPVDAHHVVPRRLDGSDATTNGRPLCRKHHYAADGERGFAKDTGWWRFNEEIKWQKIESITSAGVEQCYDLTVAEYHNYVANGFVVHNSEHAAALLVVPPETPAIDVLPLERIGGQKGKIVTSYSERAGKNNQVISDYGLMKFDWLRVAELDKQDRAVELINEQQRAVDAVEPGLVLNDLPVHMDPYAVDHEVMEMLGLGYLSGVFQLAGVAAKLTKRVKPTNMFELAAINALIRPASRNVGDDERYVRRRHGLEPVTYWHDDLEPHLGFTYGVIVFQESLMDVVKHVGGLTGLESDNFRKIASKLYRTPDLAKETMGQWYEQVREGFLSRGVAAEDFDRPETGYWEQLLSRCSYSFNIVHAEGYALLSYRDAFLKRWWPANFYAAYLSVGLSAIKEKRQQQKEGAVREARSAYFGIDVLPPDVNESGADYTVVGDTIRMGLGAVKNVGPAAVKAITETRAESSFTSPSDFEARVPAQRCNVIARGALVNAGAFDDFGARLDMTEEAIDAAEREVLGISLTSSYSISRYDDVLVGRVMSEQIVEDSDDGTLVTVAGDVAAVKEIKTRPKKDGSPGEPMAFVDLAYGPDLYSVTFFPGLWSWYEELIKSGRPLIVRGEKDTYNGRVSVKPFEPEPVTDDMSNHLIGEDGHHLWTHYVQDVEALARLVRSNPVPAGVA